MGISNACVCVQSERKGGRRSASVSVSVCAVLYFLPFIGGCGVCAARCLSLIFTPLLFSSEPADVVGTVPGRAFHHIIHGRRWGIEANCCVALCVCVCGRGTEWKFVWFLFFIFHTSDQRGAALSWPSWRQESSPALLAGQHISAE